MKLTQQTAIARIQTNQKYHKLMKIGLFLPTQYQQKYIIQIYITMQMKKFSILLIIFISISYIHAEDCQQCHQSYYSCTICYSNCSTFRFNSCTDDRQATLNENNCIDECCPSNSNNDHHHGDNNNQTFTSQFMNACIIKDQTENTILKVGYIALLAVSSAVTLIVFIIIVRALYTRCKGSRPVLASRISPIIHESSNIDLNYNINGNHTQQIIIKKDFPENSDEIIRDEANTCCICLDGNVTSLTKCGHVFHLDCLVAWCNRKNSCPLCSYKKINETRVYCSDCKSIKKTIDLKKSNFIQVQSLKRSGCKNCKG